MINTNKDIYNFDDLIEIMKYLRSEKGCSWDRKQTHESLRGTVLEESYEVIEAINNKDIDNLKEELGDLLLQVVFHSEIAEEEHNFSINNVISSLCTKLIRRHPHIFAEIELIQSEQVQEQWDLIKKKEHNYSTISEEMKAIPKALPALVRASKVQKKAAKIGFDFENITDVFDKVYEELDELKEAYINGNQNDINEEIGDVMFSIVNLSRFFDINVEFSLTNAIEKFINRFEGIELLAEKEKLNLNEMSILEMDELWGRIKQSSKK